MTLLPLHDPFALEEADFLPPHDKVKLLSGSFHVLLPSFRWKLTLPRWHVVLD